jgi:serine/threonine protein kinase
MPQAGEVLSQYRLVRKIGEGGMGSVWEAVHTQMRSKRAAIKVMLPSHP